MAFVKKILATVNLIGEIGMTVNQLAAVTVAKPVLINTGRVQSVDDAAIAGTLVSSVIVYSMLNDRTGYRSLYSDDDAATVATEMNSGGNAAGAVVIPLTVLKNDGSTGDGVKDFAVAQIIWVELWPQSQGVTTDSLVVIRQNDFSSLTIRVSETVAAIKALAND